jgi:hypothetical protein
VTEKIWKFETSAEAGEEADPAELSVRLADLGFIRSALRRSAKVWCVTAAIGLLLGVGYLKVRPPAHQAVAEILLAAGGYQGEIQDDQLIAESLPVATEAAATLEHLGIHAEPQSLVKSTLITVDTDRIFTITTKATSSQLAVVDANVMAKAFLAYQAKLLNAQYDLVTKTLDQSISQEQQLVSALSRQISHLSAHSADPSQKSHLAALRADEARDTSVVITLRQAAVNNQVTLKTATNAAVQGSELLNSAIPVPASKKTKLAFPLIGLIAGLALGAGFVVLRELLSDRLRRRDDIARVLGAPVKLSVGRVRASADAALSGGNSAVERIAGHLRRLLPSTGDGVRSLALIPLDDPTVAAHSLVRLAGLCAQRGMRVVLADLSTGAPAASLLGVSDPGLHEARLGEAKLVIVVADSDDIAPAGPLNYRSTPAWSPSADTRLVAACRSADLVLTLATLDPAIGGEYLAGWTRSAVVFLTAGRSAADRIHAVGEMIRIADIEHVSAVLVGADKRDNSLGAAQVPPARDLGHLPAEAVDHPEAPSPAHRRELPEDHLLESRSG